MSFGLSTISHPTLSINFKWCNMKFKTLFTKGYFLNYKSYGGAGKQREMQEEAAHPL